MLRLLSFCLLLAVLAAAQVGAVDSDLDIDGLGLVETEAHLGKPDLLTRDPPAEIWQYAKEHCVLYVFFYPAQDGRTLVVEHVDQRMRDGFADRPDLCLGRDDSLAPQGTGEPLVPLTDDEPPLPVTNAVPLNNDRNAAE